MIQLHLILQGKGGVGKSYVASLITQHFLDREITPICIDTDPVNQTFAGYEEFNVHPLQLLEGDDINPRAFDQLVDQVMGAEENSTFIVDNGASCFVPLCSWLIENKAIEFFEENNIELVIHSVLTGGQALDDTMTGLGNLFEHFPNTSSVVWLNQFQGKIEKNGVKFEDTALYQDNSNKIRALIYIPEVRKETFGADLQAMLEQKISFAKARQNQDFSIMARQRLHQIWRDLNTQMSSANL